MKNISLSEAYSTGVLLKHIDNKVYQINKEEGDALHLHEGLRKIKGLGMPILKSNGDKGDLFVRFNIVLPQVLDDDKIKELTAIFPKESEITLSENDVPSVFTCIVPSEEDMHNLEYDSEDDTDGYDEEDSEDYDEEDDEDSDEEDEEDYDEEDEEDYDEEDSEDYDEEDDSLIIEEEVDSDDDNEVSAKKHTKNK